MLYEGENGNGLSDDARQERLELYARLCRERGERSTVQRRVILEATLELGNHPSADQIHDAVRSRLPGIGRPTVYRVLEHLAHIGVIGKACHPGSVTRFDTRIDLHHHLVCTSCDQFVDFSDPALDAVTIPDTTNLGFEVSDYRVQLRGLCRNCLDAKRKEGST